MTIHPVIICTNNYRRLCTQPAGTLGLAGTPTERYSSPILCSSVLGLLITHDVRPFGAQPQWLWSFVAIYSASCFRSVVAVFIECLAATILINSERIKTQVGNARRHSYLPFCGLRPTMKNLLFLPFCWSLPFSVSAVKIPFRRATTTTKATFGISNLVASNGSTSGNIANIQDVRVSGATATFSIDDSS